MIFVIKILTKEQFAFEYAIIDNVDVEYGRYLMNKIKQMEREILEQTTLPIQPNFQTTKYRKCFKSKGKQTQIVANTYEELVKEVYNHIYGICKNTTIKSVFDMAFEKMISTTSKDEKTFKSYKDYFKRFISDDFSKKNINNITLDDLRLYSKSIVISMKLNEKSFKKYKSVLNLIYRFAYEEGIVHKDLAQLIKPSDYSYDYAINPKSKEADFNTFTPEQIDLIKKEIRKRQLSNLKGSKSNGYGILLSILTGARVSEICALKWKDVSFRKFEIWIHEQQLKEFTPKGQANHFYDVPWTKNEKDHSGKGRYFPIYSELKDLLSEIKKCQDDLGIKSDYVICHRDGSHVCSDAYETYLRRLCKDKLGLDVTNNHAFRKTLNSYVLIQVYDLATRAYLLGHSPETNLKYYTFNPYATSEEKASKIDDFKAKLDTLHPITPDNVIDFQQKKSLKAL